MITNDGHEWALQLGADHVDNARNAFVDALADYCADWSHGPVTEAAKALQAARDQEMKGPHRGEAMKIEPILCPHGRATSYEVDGATMDDVVPLIEWCQQCADYWNSKGEVEIEG